MFELLKQMLRRNGVTPNPASRDFSVQRALLAAVLTVAVLCLFAEEVAENAWDSLYRMAWLVFCAVPMLMIYAVFSWKGDFARRRTFLMGTMVLLQLMLMVGIYATLPALQTLIPGMTESELLLVLPYMLAPAVASVLVNRRFGTFAALATTLFGLPLFPVGTPYSTLVLYVLVSFFAGVVSADLFSKVQRREQNLYAGALAGLFIFFSVVLLGGLQGTVRFSSALGFDFLWLGVALLVTVGFNFLLAVLFGGVMPMLEKIFNISTHITWLEWADMNHPLLKKLQLTAPGTFHHSLYVQRLAEAAAEAVGADVTRAGVCALYHDIGKLDSSDFFAENIVDQTNSPHKALTPEASARIITSHVTKGVELAREYKLNRRIIDVIREHHGVSTAYFFFRKSMDRYEEDKRKFEEGLTDTSPEEVDKSIFTYRGPIPQTRESGIVSMADAVESATRSLQHPTEEDIRSMIESIFKSRILDGHLQDSGLTLGDIARMKESFFTTLRTMNHSRISYPKPKDEDSTVTLVEKRKA